ncbi:MAG TPA: hypothetical protein VFS24_21200, partial [Steroidobacteraceae bacterium]|nr:hypothetical protein [Steroidobacteraceae bacterium]
HVDPKKKAFQLDMRSLGWELIEEEVRKCLLFCANCHAEEHNPDSWLAAQSTDRTGAQGFASLDAA